MFFKALILLLSIWQVLSVEVGPPFPPNGPSERNITTPPVTTTTHSTTTTTSAPTTKSTTSGTTTLSTTSTTPAPSPSPTPAPTPKPDNKLVINDYSGNYNNSKNICFMARMALQIEVLTKDNSSFINVPKNVSATVNCPSNSSSEALSIDWDKNSIDFAFLKNGSQYEVQSVNATVLLTGLNGTVTFCHNKTEFAVPEQLSYYCVREQHLNLTNCKTNDTVALLHLSHLQYQAFMNSTKAQYASVWNCDGANTSDVVPVVVGCVLAILVVLVLVAYLVGRRRCQARGYLSM